MTRRFTTADLENLTEGTSEGTWEVSEGAVEVFAVTRTGRSFVADTGSHLVGSKFDALADAQSDARLIAAAPELAAELHRIITALEVWREREQLILNDPTTWDGTKKLAAHTINQITLILGDNNE